jgi:hypothetical protein
VRKQPQHLHKPQRLRRRKTGGSKALKINSSHTLEAMALKTYSFTLQGEFFRDRRDTSSNLGLQNMTLVQGVPKTKRPRL